MKRYETAALFYNDARKTYVALPVAIGIPAGVAFLSGILFGILAGGIAWYIDAQYPLRIAAIAGSIAGIIAMINAIRWWREMVFGVESTLTAMNNPSIAMNPVKIEHIENKGRVSRFHRLPGAQAQHAAVAKHIVSGGTLSLRSLYSFYTQPEAQEYLDALIKYGYAAWRNLDVPQAGVRVTNQGMEMFQKSLEHYNIPPLPQGSGLLSYNPYLDTHADTQEEGDE